MGEDSGDKTEEPTQHKLQEARKKGQIAKTKEITAAILFFASFFMLKAVAGNIWNNLVTIMSFCFEQIPYQLSTAMVGKLLSNALWLFMMSIGPIFGVIFGVALLVEALQTGFLITFEPLVPKLEKLNPIEGFKKFFSLKQYVELLKSILKMGVVVYILYGIIKDKLLFVLTAVNLPLWKIIMGTADIVMTTVIRVGIFYIAVALFDFFYQRFEYNKQMKMTKKEIKDEYKKLEGDPQIKQRQRDAARQMSQGRQTAAVPGADVVVTNPTHIAIALMYKANQMKAPIVVAKGERLFAEQIKRIAEQHMVPVIENKILARALFKHAIVGKPVPADYYKAVAEILAFVFHLKKKRKARVKSSLPPLKSPSTP